jgi:hypothetical protein
MFVKDQVYRRIDLHERYGGQRQGGISTPLQHKLIFLFSSVRGEQYGYTDGWIEDGKYLYTGEGQIGDMQFKGGNLAVRDHFENAEEIHLFEYVRVGHVRYVGQMRFENYQIRDGLDKNEHPRKIIVFTLIPVSK